MVVNARVALTEKTFTAEVEVLREESRACSMTIEGEFWSETKMGEEGMSERFGTS